MKRQSLRPKKVFSPEDFQTRSQRRALIQEKNLFPECNQNRVIVESNNEAMGFNFKSYNKNKQYLENRIDKKTFDNTVMKAQKICDHVWRLRKQQEKTDYQAESKYYILFAFLLSLISFGLLISVVYYTQDMIVLYIAIGIIGFAACLVLFVAVQTLFINPTFIDFEEEIKKRLSQFLQHENENIYLEKGLKWQMEPQFYWLELHIQDIKNKLITE